MPDPIRVDHISDELRVQSPGSFFGGISSDTILTAQPRTRNRHFGDVLRSLRLAEREGTGVDIMFRELIRIGQQPPRILEQGDGVTATLYGGTPQWPVLEVLATLPVQEQQDVRYTLLVYALLSRPSVRATELAPLLQVERDLASDFIRTALQHQPFEAMTKKRQGEVAVRLSDAARSLLASALPYYRRPAAESAAFIVAEAAHNGTISSGDVQEILGVSGVQASRLLTKLVESDVLEPLEPEQRGRNAAYRPGLKFSPAASAAGVAARR
jgi:ATP-dependent DNA helicase RecG